jgi:hypothetical protein
MRLRHREFERAISRRLTEYRDRAAHAAVRNLSRRARASARLAAPIFPSAAQLLVAEGTSPGKTVRLAHVWHELRGRATHSREPRLQETSELATPLARN